ncbi:tripartite motif-containing protein 2-like [Lingula anatina]|uniref:Tripartite motif-containing protein 2-like n=1 Tax=Lingula anatina TaxID=7574 RepID=A0A2R2MU19_LINAN|nr:tripartite motif-containing protein 2-like [Lingula anatina]|eukprot:XP_023933648.1 tripartite motif-containing protein 2-like [Lingula anatina]
MAEALAADIKNNILTCNICLEEYEDPRVLPCYHTFCYGCISDHATHTLTPNRTFLCPICREEIQFPAGGLNQLKKNFVFSKAKDIITKQQESQKLEEEQTNVAAVAQGTAQMTNSCEKHPNKKFKYYCEDDDTVICSRCIATEHSGHRISSVEQVAKINRDKIKVALVKTMKTLNRFKEAVAKGIITESSNSQITAATIKANKENLEFHHASLHSACDFAQELITNGTDSDIMVHAKSLIERLAEMEKTPVPTPDTPAQISYIPGNSTVQSQPLLAEQGTNFNSAFYPSVFLKKAECVHSFNSVLKDECKNALFQLNGLAIDEEQVYVVDQSRNKVKIFTHAGEFKFDTKVQCPYDVAVSQTVLFITSLGDRQEQTLCTCAVTYR